MLYPPDRNLKRFYYHSQKGMVVIMALFIVAIVAALSYAVLASLARDTHRTEMILHDLALTNYAQGGIAWAEDLLLSNVTKKSPDRRIDVMPTFSPINKEHGYRIVTRIDDMQGRYNINRLASSNKERKEEFVRLLQAVNIKLDQKQQDLLIDAIKDWMIETEGRPDLNRFYDERPIPYRAAHQRMAHISELRLVKGITPTLYAKLSPHLVALPGDETQVNIFSAPPEVLMTLGPNITLDQALALSKAVASIQTSDRARLEKLPLLANLKIQSNQFTLESEYFLVETRVSIESQQLVIYTLMERKSSSIKKPIIKIIWQSKGIA